MSLIERIKETAGNRRNVRVPEWDDGDEPCIIYATALSVKDMAWVQRRHKHFLDEMKVEGMVDLIIRKCQDKDGEKLFTLEDKQPLMIAAQVSTISALFGDLWGDLYEDAGKK